MCHVAGEGYALQVFGDVQISLVQRQRFDDRRVLREDVEDLPADRFVDLEARFYENQVRTLPLGGDGCHRRANSELAGLVACRSYDAAFRRAADRDWLASKIWIVPLLDRRVEGVHVYVDDLAVGKAGVGSAFGRCVHLYGSVVLGLRLDKSSCQNKKGTT